MKLSPDKSITEGYSQRAIKRAVVKNGVSHWLTLYPPAIGIPVGLAGFLFGSPLLYLVSAGAISIGVASAIINIYFQEDKAAKKYLEKLSRQLKLKEQETLEHLAADLQKGLKHPQGKGFADQALEQLTRLRRKYENVNSVLSRKLSTGEITFSRFIGAAEQVYLSALDNLKDVASLLDSVGSIDKRYIVKRLGQIAKGDKNSSANIEEKAALVKRYNLLEDQLKKVDMLLSANEKAMTAMEETTASIAQMQTDKNFSETDFDSAIKQLQEIAERTYIYSNRQ